MTSEISSADETNGYIEIRFNRTTFTANTVIQLNVNSPIKTLIRTTYTANQAIQLNTFISPFQSVEHLPEPSS